MTPNMGAADKKLRLFVIAPLALIAAFVVGLGKPLGIVLLVVAALGEVTRAMKASANELARSLGRVDGRSASSVAAALATLAGSMLRRPSAARTRPRMSSRAVTSASPRRWRSGP